MTCGGTGKAPCKGCPECEPADDAAERAERHGRLSEWYHAQAGTAPPRAKGEAKAAKAKGDDQGRLFG